MLTTPGISTGQSVVTIGQPSVIQQTPSDHRLSVNIIATRNLGILQVVAGVIGILFGILAAALLHYYAAHVAFPIWSGVWILVGGILGISSSRDPTNRCLNSANMVFAIVSCCLAFVNFFVYAFAIGYFSKRSGIIVCSWGYCYHSKIENWEVGVATYSILLVCMVAEFIFALSASIYCCKLCCNLCESSPQVFVQQPVVSMQTPYVQTSHVYQPAPVATYPTFSSGYNQAPGQQMGFTTATGPVGIPPAMGQPQQVYFQGSLPAAGKQEQPPSITY